MNALGRSTLTVVTVIGCAYAAATWSEKGPAIGGRLSAIVAVPGSSPTVLLAASPGGGVWRSVDAGANWTFPANYGTGDFSVVHLEWDAIHPGRLFALSYNGLHASTDRADSWTALINSGGMPAPLLPNQASVADPKPFAQMKFSNTQSAVLAALPCSGLQYSFDGTHFTQNWPFSGGSGNPDNCIGNIAADPVSGRVYFSTLKIDAFAPAHVFRSDCGATHWAPGTPCLTWTPVSTGLPSNAIVAAMVYAGAANRLVLQTNVSSTLNTYLTTNGTSWTLQSARPNAWSPRALVYTGGQELIEGNVLAARSNDLGATWTAFNLPANHPDTRAIYTDAAAGKLWTVTDGSMSGNYANVTRWNWTPGNAPSGGVDLGHNGLKTWQTYYTAVVPAPGGARRVFAGAQDNAGLCSDSLGASWTTNGIPPGFGSGDYPFFQSAPSDANRAYVFVNDPTHFARTTNASSAANCAAVTWTTLTPTHSPAGAQLIASSFWSYHALAVSPTDPNLVVFAFAREIGVSTNAGAATPLITHRQLPSQYNPSSVYVDGGGNIYVGTFGHGVYVSADLGQHWSPWGLNSGSPAIVTAIAIAGQTNWIASTSGLYKKQGAAGAWTLANIGQGYTVSDVKVDPACATRVYISYGFAAVQGLHRGGVDVSTNNGGTWQSLTAGQALHQGPVPYVQVDSLQPRTVYAGSYGRGFWVYDWGGAPPACMP